MEQAATTVLRGIDELLAERKTSLAFKLLKNVAYTYLGDRPELRSDFKKVDYLLYTDMNYEKAEEILHAIIGRVRDELDAPRGSAPC